MPGSWAYWLNAGIKGARVGSVNRGGATKFCPILILDHSREIRPVKTINFFALSVLLLSSCTSSTAQFQVGQIRTAMGDILIWLYQDVPEHRINFIELAEAGYWDDYTFNRVIEGFVAQGGCPDTPEGFAYSIHLLEPEFRENLKHVYGTFAAGRDDNPGKLSAGCQFYIVQDPEGIPRLDNNYTIYGQVFRGMDVIESIVRVETDSADAPLEDIELDVNVVQMTRAAIEASGFEIPLGNCGSGLAC